MFHTTYIYRKPHTYKIINKIDLKIFYVSKLYKNVAFSWISTKL